MADHLILLSPSGNRVYSGENARLTAAELSIMLHDEIAVAPVRIAGVDYLQLDVDRLDDRSGAALTWLSSRLAVFRRQGEALHPVEIAELARLDDDLLTIPKYPGKTNELFTRLLLNVTAGAAQRKLGPDTVVLDPMCGRGTTLSATWIRGWNGAGVESDAKAVEAYSTFLRTYLRRKRLKHSVESTPVRRDGRSVGRRLDATVSPTMPDDTGPRLSSTVFTGDTRDSAALWGKRRFDLVVVDAPYGVVHTSQTGGSRKRSAADLLGEALGVWAGQLKHGGALGLAWNTYAITREALTEHARSAGLTVMDSEPFRRLAHRVDASIHRDVLVAVKS